MITKELLIKARDTLPQELCAQYYYEQETHRYCALGWLAHTAGIKVQPFSEEERNMQSEEFVNFERTLPNGGSELMQANDECTWEHERYDRVLHVLNNWIRMLDNAE